MSIRYRVKCNNQFERETSQKILFKLGYSWGFHGNGGNELKHNEFDYISVRYLKRLTYGINSMPTYDISFEEFITKLENEL